METPYLTHITPDDYKYVYEPSEDSFLLLDALEADLSNLISIRPAVCLEIGSGSGVIITAIAKVLSETICFAIDINPRACAVTKRTAVANGVNALDVINMNLLDGFQSNAIDVLIFNPPYVVTPDDELDTSSADADALNDIGEVNSNIIKSWAGGADGRVIMDRVFDSLNDILTLNGVAYILVIKENKPLEIMANLKEKIGFHGEIVAERRIRGEHLFVLRIQRSSK